MTFSEKSKIDIQVIFETLKTSEFINSIPPVWKLEATCNANSSIITESLNTRSSLSNQLLFYTPGT
jgi:hypothetical protein